MRLASPTPEPSNHDAGMLRGDTGSTRGRRLCNGGPGTSPNRIRDAPITHALRFMHAIVTNVKVKTLPFSKDEGEPWDLFSGPDLYYEAYGPGDECLHASDVANDIRPRDLPVALDGEFAVESPDRHVLRLLDADLTGQEVIARIAFVPARWAEEGPGPEPPRCIRLADEDTTLQLTLTWNQVPA